MRTFEPEYLTHTRRGLWDDRRALAPLALGDRERVFDIGAGTGALTRVLDAETPASTPVFAVDADRRLLRVARSAVDCAVVQADATQLSLDAGVADLAACQALLVNLRQPRAAVEELARVSTDFVATVEPDNAAVAVSSTVDTEPALERRARTAFIEGVQTDVAPGDRVPSLFRESGLDVVATRRHHHVKRVEPPYDERAVRGAARKASGEGLAVHERELRRTLGDEGYDDLRERWRSMGRAIIEGIRTESYRRVEVVPFDVTVGRA